MSRPHLLAGGTFVFKSIQVGSQGQLLCADACQIGVADTVQLKSKAVLGGTGGTRAEEIRVNVAKTSKNFGITRRPSRRSGSAPLVSVTFSA